MKKLTTLLIAAGLVFAASAPASAVDVKMDGTYEFQWTQTQPFSSMQLGNDGKMHNIKGDGAAQSVWVGAKFSVSESLSAYFQLKAEWTWGNNAYNVPTSAFGGHDGTVTGSVVRLYRSYVDWMVPGTTVKVRMGRHDIALPALANGKNSAVWWKDPTDGITVSAKCTDWLDITGFWGRYQRTNGTWSTWDTSSSKKGDIFGLFANIRAFDGFQFNPFVAYGNIGRGLNTQAVNNNTPVVLNDSGELAASQIIWAGISGAVNLFDPFVVKYGFVYGNRTFDKTDAPSQRGWFADLAFSYKTAYGTPELYLFYGSGDHKNAEYAYQGNMPSYGGRFKGSYGFFNGQGVENNELENNHTGHGAWGIRAAWRGLSFVEGLSHDFAVLYAAGTNHKSNADFGINPSRYMTTKDSIVELDFGTNYQIYKNLAAYLECAYVIQNFETENDGDFFVRAKDYDNAWKVALMLTYKF